MLPCGQTRPQHAAGSPRGLRPLPLSGGYPLRDRRAPPRGVDVKQPPRRGRGGPGTPIRGSGPDPRDPGSRIPGHRSPDTGDGLGPPLRGGPDSRTRIPEGPGDLPRRPPGGCFYINPSRRGPVASRGVSRDRGPRRGLGARSQDPKNPPPRRGTSKTPKPRDRAPARGVDVKPPPRGRPGPEFWTSFKDFGHFWPNSGFLAR